MKNIFLILLLFTLGCSKQEDSASDTDIVIINHGPLNKNIKKIEGSVYQTFTVNGVSFGYAFVKYNMQTLQYQATIYDSNWSPQCALNKPISANVYSQIRSAIDTAEVCTNNKVDVCPLLYLPTDQFYLFSQSGLELEAETYNFPGCSSSRFACDTDVAKDLASVTQALIQTDLVSCP